MLAPLPILPQNNCVFISFPAKSFVPTIMRNIYSRYGDVIQKWMCNGCHIETINSKIILCRKFYSFALTGIHTPKMGPPQHSGVHASSMMIWPLARLMRALN